MKEKDGRETVILRCRVTVHSVASNTLRDALKTEKTLFRAV